MGGSGLGVGALSCVAAAGDQAPKDHRPPGLTAALCRPHRKDAARGVLKGGAQSLQCTGGISREAGRERERGCGGGEGHGRMEVDEDGGKSPFPGSPGPALVSQPIDTHPLSIKSAYLCPPALLFPNLNPQPPHPSCISARAPPLLTPHPILLTVRAGTWAKSTDETTSGTPVFRGHQGTDWHRGCFRHSLLFG